MDFKTILPKVMGFIAIVITLALAPAIYTANLTVVNYGGGSGMVNFTGMDAVSPYGGFLLILGILIAQGIFQIAGFGGGKSEGWKDLVFSVGIVIAVIILLNVYASAVLPAFTKLIASASVADDSIGQTVFGVLPIVIYLGIIITSVAGEGGKAIYNKVKGRGKKHGRRTALGYA